MSNLSALVGGASAASAPATPAVSISGSDVKYDFRGRLALVTGSTQGIGFAIAQAYVRSGADVVVNGRDQKKVDGVVATLTKDIVDSKQKVHGVGADVSTSAGCASLVERVNAIAKASPTAGGAPDFVVLNASALMGLKTFFDSPDDEWSHMFTSNVLSVVRLVRAFLPALLKRNAHGRIIVTSSVAAYAPMSPVLPYTVSKAAQTNLVRGLADLTKGTSVTINSLTVGPTFTEGFAAMVSPGKSTAEASAFADGFAKSLPGTLNRAIHSDEIAAGTMYISSKAAVISNGAGIRLDGAVLQYI